MIDIVAGSGAMTVDAGSGAATPEDASVESATTSHLVLALVGLDPIALLCTPDVVMGGRR